MDPTLGDMNKNVSICLNAVERAKKDSCEIVVLPELALTGYFVKDLMSELGIVPEVGLKDFMDASSSISIVIGFIERSKNYRFYNSVAFIEKGMIKHVHRKIYLPTYGMFDEARYFGRGDEVRAFDCDLGRFGMAICEDIWHPAVPYILACDDAELMFFVASSPGRGLAGNKIASGESWERINHYQARSYGCFVAYCNRVGYEDGVNFWGGSELISPFGETLAKAPYFDEAMVSSVIEAGEMWRSNLFSPLRRDEDISITIRELKRIDAKRVENRY